MPSTTETAAHSQMIEQLELFRNRTGEYNKIYKYRWKTSMEGLRGGCKTWLDDNCEDAWGWHFEKSHKDNASYLVITFQEKYDLINAKFMMPDLELNR